MNKEQRSTPKVISEQLVYEDTSPAHLTVTKTELRLCDGTRVTTNSVAVKNGIPGAVCIVVCEQHVLLACHWRTATRQWGWEFPRGMGEQGETPEATAARELKEECGLAAFSVEHIGSFNADTGILRNSVAVVVCSVSSLELSSEHDFELSDLTWFSADEVAHMIGRGEIYDGITLAAWALWRGAACY